MLGVRHGHSAADAGATQLLALHHRLDNSFDLGALDSPRLLQRLSQLVNPPGLVFGLQTGANRLGTNKVSKLHGSWSFLNLPLLVGNRFRLPSALCPIVVRDLLFILAELLFELL